MIQAPRHQPAITHVSPKVPVDTKPFARCTPAPFDSKPVVFWRRVFPHPLRGEPRRAFGHRSWNVTWHREGTAPLTKGAQVRVELRPRQLSGLARSPTPGGGRAGRGQRESDAGRTGRGGKRVPREAGASWEARAARARLGDALGPRPECPPAAGARRAGGWTRAALARLGTRRPAPLRPREGPREGRRPGPPRPQLRLLKGDQRHHPGAEKPVWPVRQSGGKRAAAEEGGADAGRGKAGSHWRAARARGAAANWTRFPGPRPAPCAMKR